MSNDILYYSRSTGAHLAAMDRDISQAAIDRGFPAPTGDEFAIWESAFDTRNVRYGYDGAWHAAPPAEAARRWKQAEAARAAVEAEGAKARKRAQASRAAHARRDHVAAWIAAQQIRVSAAFFAAGGERMVRVSRPGGVQDTPLADLQAAGQHNDEAGYLYRSAAALATSIGWGRPDADVRLCVEVAA